MAEPPHNWTGFYAGLNAGGSWGKQDNSLETTAGVLIQQNTAKLDGAIGGGQIGYNWQTNQIVFGIEADLDASGQKGDGNPLYFSPGVVGVGGAFSIPYTDRLEWFGTLRGRLGWANNNWLAYVTGGWAFGGGKIDGLATIAGATTPFSNTHTYSGWTGGGGIEYAFNNRWSAKLEYLYIDFGDGPTVQIPPLKIVAGKMTDNIVRAGINYKFF
jgi:outer membrane immunogenic protein